MSNPETKTRRTLKWWAVAPALSLVALLALSVAVPLAYSARYRDRVYPGVSAAGVDLGGMTAEEVAAALATALPDPTTQQVTLQNENRAWVRTWAAFGVRYDVAAAVEQALAVGREGSLTGQLSAQWQARSEGYDVTVALVAADRAQVQAVLEGLVEAVRVEPRDAVLSIGPQGVAAAPGQVGCALDVPASVERVLAALEPQASGDSGSTVPDSLSIPLAVQQLPPAIAQPEPAQSLAQALLSAPFTLAVDDLVTSYSATWAVPPQTVAGWLRAVPSTATGQISLTVETSAVQAALQALAPELGAERILDVESSLPGVVAALAAGEHRAALSVRHPAQTYTVDWGDILFNIAFQYGFPAWRLVEANPHIDPDNLIVGTVITIPSVDVLLPYPVVPDRLIEISLDEQRLRAYQDGELVYDFRCSSGMTSTPTLSGIFQVLYKDPEAYAERWYLRMPNFMGVYHYDGPDYVNGIHALPIRPDGSRLWASVLGHPASYGCIILGVDEAQQLYDWAPLGTLVRITGVTPGMPTYEEALQMALDAQAAEEAEQAAQEAEQQGEATPAPEATPSP